MYVCDDLRPEQVEDFVQQIRACLDAHVADLAVKLEIAKIALEKIAPNAHPLFWSLPVEIAIEALVKIREVEEGEGEDLITEVVKNVCPFGSELHPFPDYSKCYMCGQPATQGRVSCLPDFPDLVYCDACEEKACKRLAGVVFDIR